MISVRLLRFAVLASSISLALLGSAASQEADNPLQDLARKAKLLPEPVEPKEFVKQLRPAQTDFLPIGMMPPARPLKVKSPEELKAMQADLEAAGLRHDKISGRPPTKGAQAEQKTTKKLKGSQGRSPDAKDPKS